MGNKQAQQDVKLWLANDWELKDETPEYYLLTKRKQSIFLHIVLLFATMGIGNVIYFFCSNKKKKVFK